MQEPIRFTFIGPGGPRPVFVFTEHVGCVHPEQNNPEKHTTIIVQGERVNVMENIFQVMESLNLSPDTAQEKTKKKTA